MKSCGYHLISYQLSDAKSKQGDPQKQGSRYRKLRSQTRTARPLTDTKLNSDHAVILATIH